MKAKLEPISSRWTKAAFNLVLQKQGCRAAVNEGAEWAEAGSHSARRPPKLRRGRDGFSDIQLSACQGRHLRSRAGWDGGPLSNTQRQGCACRALLAGVLKSPHSESDSLVSSSPDSPPIAATPYGTDIHQTTCLWQGKHTLKVTPKAGNKNIKEKMVANL